MKLFFFCLLTLCICCQSDRGCQSGTIDIATLSKSQGKTATSSQTDLPAEFTFTPNDMKNAMIGSWLNKNGDTVFMSSLGPSSQISYNVGEEGYKCGPTFARMFFICTSKKPQALSFNGEITFYNSTDSGGVSIDISNIPYSMKYFFNEIDSSYTVVPSRNIPELGLSIGDSLKMSH